MKWGHNVHETIEKSLFIEEIDKASFLRDALNFEVFINMNEDFLKSAYTFLEGKRSEYIFGVYIDYPFCISNCNYCIYHSLNYGSYKTKISEYENAVISQIKNISYLLDDFKPDTIYWGGGTPSLWSDQALATITTIIPGYNTIPVKKIELHPYDLSRQKIDTIINTVNPDIVSIGIQSLNENSCQVQHRINVSVERITQIVKAFHDHGIWVNIDLVALFGGDSETDWMVFEDDLNTICNVVKPDVITSIPNYRTHLNYMEQIPRFRSVLKNACNGKYRAPSDFALSMDSEDIKKYGRNDHWIATDEYWDFVKKNKIYSSTGPKTGIKTNQMVFAFGGAEQHRVYSYLPDNKTVVYSHYSFKENKFCFSTMGDI